MRIPTILSAVAFGFTWMVGLPEGQTATGSRPNILILYADDLGYGDVRCYNPERGKIPTPHIDRLAAEGMRFTDAHSSSGVCSPSRYTLLTGRYHWRSRLQRGIVGLWGPPLIPPTRTTIGALAQRAGYRTACIGKWHLGWRWPITEENRELFRTTGYNGRKDLTVTEEHQIAWRDAFSQAIPGGPTAVGFDTYFGTDVPNWPPYCFIENDRTVGLPSEYANPELFARNQASQQGPALKDWTLEPILPTLGERGVAFLEAASRSPEPFLLYMPFTSPHTPLSVNEEWKGQSGLNLYADFVMETDAVIGAILDALERFQLANNTMVLFTSDNGCAPYIDVEALEAQGHYPSGPLRGYKNDVWEGGHRVPFIIRWPGQVASNRVEDALVHQADVFATIADIVDIPLDPSAGEDSFSLLPLILGTSDAIRDTAVSCAGSGLPSFRMGSWKYIAGVGSGGWSSGGEDGQPVQLYNLADDLGETRNWADQAPDRLRAMQSRFEELIASGASRSDAQSTNDVPVVRYPK